VIIRHEKVVTNLWCQVEPQKAAVGQLVLYEERNLIGEAEIDLAAQAGGLAEVDEVFQGKGEVYWLGEGDVHVQVGLVHVRVLP
jgi:hypothetical protein